MGRAPTQSLLGQCTRGRSIDGEEGADPAEVLAGALRGRGLSEPDANLAAEVGIAVFKIAFERWIDEANDRDFSQLVRGCLDELQTLTAR